jgi:hypothetical protein
MKAKSSTSVESFKWLAQIIGFWTTASLLLFTFIEVIPRIDDGGAILFIPMLPLLALGVSGYILSWYRELAGATMLVAGGLSSVLYILLMIKDTQTALIIGLPLALSGILYLIHWTIQFRKHHNHSANKH